MNFSEKTSELLTFINTHHDLSARDQAELSSRYQELIDNLTQHNQLYYIQSSPIISDFEYDTLFACLKNIENFAPHLISPASPTQMLIGQIADGFSKAEHKIPLLSLENSYNAEDLLSRDQRRKKIAEKADLLGGSSSKNQIFYLLEAKFDGLSVEIIYQNGLLSQAITRGDGKTGEDITANIKTIKNLPKKLPLSLNIRIRGEVMMPKSQLKILNESREKQGLNLFANTRNAASGSLKLLDSAEVAKRGLICFLYDILESENPDITLHQLGLPTFSLPEKYQHHECIKSVIATCQKPQVKAFLDQQDFDFDGLVIKLDQKDQKAETSIRSYLGSTEHHPRRAIAYKFPAQQVATKILSVDFQVGRTGIITPVANLESVSLGGVTISRVSLHNFDFITQKGILNGDFVRIQRSGEVIPYILGTIPQRRNGSETTITPPSQCPYCGGEIQHIEPHFFCKNPHCLAQLKEKILYFVSRDALDIAGFGESIIDLLVEQKILKSIADLYTLLEVKNQVLLRKFPSFGEKKVAELSSELNNSKQKPLRRLLNALGIPNIGKKTAQDLANHLAQKNLKNLNDLLVYLQNTNELSSIYGIGEKVAVGIGDFFSDPYNIQIITELSNHGLNFCRSDLEESTPKLSSKEHFSITGTFPIPRSEITKHLVDLGYHFDETPNQHTDFILIGEKAGSKAEKAQKLNLKIYQNREEICAQFNFPSTPLTKKTEKPDLNARTITQGGLF